MKAIHAFFVLFLMGFVVSCSTIYGVQYDYDKQADFKSLKTYDWITVPEKANIDSLNVERVKKVVNAELQAKGLMMTSNNPDFLIAEHMVTKDKIQVEDWGYGYSRHGRYRRSSSYQYEEGSLCLDFIDAKSKKMIWRGVAKAVVDYVNTPEQSEKLIPEFCTKLTVKANAVQNIFKPLVIRK
jgi:Domain of unknown function (DUF4136)